MILKSHTATQPLGLILVIEDDPIFVDWLNQALSKINLSFDIVNTLQKGMDCLKTTKEYQAVLTDLYYEGDLEPSGMQLIKQAETLGLPVIAMTSNLSKESAVDSANSGASYILEKPFTPQKLKEVLEYIWEQPRGLTGVSEHLFKEYNLTSKEREVARLILKGLNSNEVASAINVSVKTVKSHLTNIFSKCDVKSRSELINLFIPY